MFDCNSKGSANGYDCGYESVVRSFPATQSSLEIPSTAYQRRDVHYTAPRIKRIMARTISATVKRKIASTNCVDLSIAKLFVPPWSYKWTIVLALGVVASIISYVLAETTHSPVAHFLCAAIMSICVPAATTCLLIEWDISQRVSWVAALMVATSGGCLSAIVAGVTNGFLEISEGSAGFAALTEEPLKGAILFALLFANRHFPGILSGLVLGCSVGAGFAVWETIDYAYALSDTTMPSTQVLLIRGILSPMMHMAWTGMLGAAMWDARGSGPFVARVFLSPATWMVFVGMVLFHALWNTIPLAHILFFMLWAWILHYIHKGVAQAFELGIAAKKGIV